MLKILWIPILILYAGLFAQCLQRKVSKPIAIARLACCSQFLLIAIILIVFSKYNDVFSIFFVCLASFLWRIILDIIICVSPKKERPNIHFLSKLGSFPMGISCAGINILIAVFLANHESIRYVYASLKITPIIFIVIGIPGIFLQIFAPTPQKTNSTDTPPLTVPYNSNPNYTVPPYTNQTPTYGAPPYFEPYNGNQNYTASPYTNQPPTYGVPPYNPPLSIKKTHKSCWCTKTY